MSIIRNFVHEEWDVTGNRGLRPIWLEGTNATGGMGVAHDMLEHFLHHQGNQVEAECEAMGSMLLLRGDEAEFTTSKFGQTLGALVEEILRDGLTAPTVQKAQPLDPGTEAFLARCLDVAFGSISLDNPDYLDICFNQLALDEDEAETQLKILSQCRPGFEAWIRKGYRRAVTRYKNRNLHSIRTVAFANITKAVDSLLKTEYAWEGAKVRVKAELSGGYRAIAELWVPEEKRWIDGDFI